MKFEYEICCTIDIGKTVDDVGDILKGVNAEMKHWGFDEQLICRGTIIIGTISSNRELTRQELDDMKTLIGAEVMKTPLFSKFGIRVESLKRKSSQSCSQSYNATNATNAR